MRSERVDGVRDIDRAVVVGATKDVQGVARGHRARGFVLALEVRVAVGELRPGHHVDVGAGHDLLLRREGRARGDDQAETREPETPGTRKAGLSDALAP